jgi:hypothetical protein
MRYLLVVRSFLVVVHDPGIELVAEILEVPGAKLYSASCTAIGSCSGHYRRRTPSIGLSEPVVHVILLQLTKGYSVLSNLIAIESIQRIHRILSCCPFARVHEILVAELYLVLPSIVCKFTAMLLEDSCDSDHFLPVCWIRTLQCFEEPSAKFVKGFENLLGRAVCFWVNDDIFPPFVL